MSVAHRRDEGTVMKEHYYRYINTELSALFKKYHNPSRLNEYMDDSIFKTENFSPNGDILIKYSKTKIKQLSRQYNTNDITSTIDIYMINYITYILDSFVTPAEYNRMEEYTKMSYEMMRNYIVSKNFFDLFVFPAIGNFIIKA